MGTNVVLQLRQRELHDTVSVPAKTIAGILAEGTKDQLWAFFAEVAKRKGTVHDKQWLQMIVNWTPEGGLALAELSKWLKLVQRVDRLDDTKEGPFTLSLAQADLIWRRLTSADYKVRGLDPNFAAFVSEYLRASGHHFVDVTDEMDYDELGAP